MSAAQTKDPVSLQRVASLYSAAGDSPLLAYITANEELEPFLMEAHAKIKQYFGPKI